MLLGSLREQLCYPLREDLPVGNTGACGGYGFPYRGSYAGCVEKPIKRRHSHLRLQDPDELESQESFVLRYSPC